MPLSIAEPRSRNPGNPYAFYALSQAQKGVEALIDVPLSTLRANIDKQAAKLRPLFGSHAKGAEEKLRTLREGNLTIPKDATHELLDTYHSIALKTNPAAPVQKVRIQIILEAYRLVPN